MLEFSNRGYQGLTCHPVSQYETNAENEENFERLQHFLEDEQVVSRYFFNLAQSVEPLLFRFLLPNMKTMRKTRKISSGCNIFWKMRAKCLKMSIFWKMSKISQDDFLSWHKALNPYCFYFCELLLGSRS